MHSRYIKVCTMWTFKLLIVIHFVRVDRMLVRGNRRDITFDDLFDLKPEDKSDKIVTRFENEWKKELKKTKWE